VQEVLELWDLKNTEGFEQFLDEVDRLFHNYVAAVCTVRDHTRNVWKAHMPSVVTVQAEYGERVAKTFVTPQAQFVQRLRNFTLHERLPVARGHLSWNRESGVSSRVILDLEQLRRGKRWTGPAGEYLDEASGDIDLLDLVDSYSTLVVDFNGWFGRAFLGAHLNAIEEVKHLELSFDRCIRSSSRPLFSNERGRAAS
jgi:hypothetical protein